VLQYLIKTAFLPVILGSAATPESTLDSGHVIL